MRLTIPQANFLNSENAPAEETEANYPVRILRYELIPDSEGAGYHRGGLGVRRDYTFPGHTPSFSMLSDKAEYPPCGLFVGGPAWPATYILNLDSPQARESPSKIMFPLKLGDVVSVQTPGGSGCEAAWKWPVEQVIADVVLGKMLPGQARDAYGSSWILGR